jgi:predicted RNase H-like nuclease (RuvC/YqgF family)
MIESLMLIALGFFIATLLAAVTMQFVWRRAVTVTKRSLATDNPEPQESARAQELDMLLRRQHDATVPLQAEIDRLREEKQALAHENASLRDECARLAASLESAQQEQAFRQQESAAAAAERASRLAALKQELARLEEVISGEDTTRAPLVEKEATGSAEQAEVEQAEADSGTLADMKETIARIDAMSKAGNIALPEDQTPEERGEDDDEALPEAPLADKALIARIRALEAGVAS